MFVSRSQRSGGFRPVADVPVPRQTGRMRTTVPPAFSMTFLGPEGPYTIRFEPTDDWDGIIDVSIGALVMRWAVVDAQKEDGGGLVLGGMTTGSDELWNDQ